MASLLVRLKGSAAAAVSGYSLVGRVCTGILRSTIPQFHSSNKKCNLGHHTMNYSSASKMSPPQLMLPPAFDGGNMVYQMYNLAEDRVETPYRRRIKGSKEEELGAKVVGSSHGWLALLFNNTKLFLSNPLTCRQIKLPPYDTLRNPDDDEKSCFTVSKVILSCSPDDEEEEEECRAFMSYGFGRPNRLAFCLPGKSPHWTFVGEFDYETGDDDKYALGYSDTIYSARHKLFFCITKINCFQVCDLNQGTGLSDWNWVGKLKGEDELYNEVLHESVVKPEVKEHFYLVEESSGGQLFLVRRHILERVGHDGNYARPFYFGYRRGWDNSHPYKTVGFDVHKIDCDLKSGKVSATYMELGSLGGLTMFVGLNHSLALPAAEFPELKPNSIYFTDTVDMAYWGDEESPHPEWTDKNYGGHDIGIFSYEDRTFLPCFYPCDVPSIKRISPPPFWFTACRT